MTATMTVNRNLTHSPQSDIEHARQRLAKATADTRAVIRVMTAEQAVLALKIMREAGRRGH